MVREESPAVVVYQRGTFGSGGRGTSGAGGGRRGTSGSSVVDGTFQ
jgi:hypothetical protein